MARAMGLGQAGRPPPAVDIRQTVEREFSIPGQRLKMASPNAGSRYRNAAHIMENCRLVGVTIFVDTPDTGDYADLSLAGRVIVDRLNVDLQNNATYTESFSERASKGDMLEFLYFSAGTTSKTATWMAKAVILP